jgi:hypothetical protein
MRSGGSVPPEIDPAQTNRKLGANQLYDSGGGPPVQGRQGFADFAVSALSRQAPDAVVERGFTCIGA